MYIPIKRGPIIHYFDARGGVTVEETQTGYDKSGYYFWLETFAHVEGPYKTKEDADAACIQYIKALGYN